MPDLWPDDFGCAEAKAPVAILREQGDHLGRRTKGLVLGTVQTAREGDRFVHHFVLRAPVLDDYTYVLLSVKHSLDFYPLDLIAHSMNEGWKTISDEQAFMSRLNEVLKSDMTKRVITSLLIQSQEVGAGTGT